MHLSCWTALFPYLPWVDACRMIRVLGFSHVDLIARPASSRGSIPWDGLDLEPICAEPEQEGSRLRSRLDQLELDPAAMLVMPPADWREPGQSPEAAFHSIGLFCEHAGLPVIVFAASDIVGPWQTPPVDYESAIARLRRLQAISSDHGIQVAIEPNFTSAVRTPSASLQLVEAVPGLGLTVDPAHFVLQGFRQEEIDPLWPVARHVHVRQARPGFLQARLDKGTIDFGDVVSALRSTGYEGVVCVENILLPDVAWLTSDYLDPVAETVAMLELIRGLI